MLSNAERAALVALGLRDYFNTRWGKERLSDADDRLRLRIQVFLDQMEKIYTIGDH